jgi:hypothetical protein
MLMAVEIHIVPPKRRFIQDPHGATSQKTGKPQILHSYCDLRNDTAESGRLLRITSGLRFRLEVSLKRW